GYELYEHGFDQVDLGAEPLDGFRPYVRIYLAYRQLVARRKLGDHEGKEHGSVEGRYQVQEAAQDEWYQNKYLRCGAASGGWPRLRLQTGQERRVASTPARRNFRPLGGP